MFHTFGMDRPRHQRAGQKSAESGGKAQFFGQQHHPEADTQRGDQQRFVIEKTLGLAKQRRKDIDTEDQPQRQIQHQHPELKGKRTAGDILGHGNRGEDDHHKDPGDVFDDQRAEDQLGEAFRADAQFIKGLDDDGRRTHREHAAEKDRVHHAPAEGLSDKVAQSQHPEHFGQGRDDRRRAYGSQLVQVELETQREHQHDDADLTPCFDRGFVGHGQEIGHIRADKEAGQNIAQYKGKLQTLEKHGHYACRQQHDGEIGDQFGHDILRKEMLLSIIRKSLRRNNHRRLFFTVYYFSTRRMPRAGTSALPETFASSDPSSTFQVPAGRSVGRGSVPGLITA